MTNKKDDDNFAGYLFLLVFGLFAIAAISGSIMGITSGTWEGHDKMEKFCNDINGTYKSDCREAQCINVCCTNQTCYRLDWIKLKNNTVEIEVFKNIKSDGE